ncbi:YciI family protein [Gallaecimonas mangrovi]|uniref:YciI family protein n=1 Tax=Gallaecimonas mangrovi TaxID=2291597 RepID=UPI000E201B7F|nr:YciI family protein [Gallaecimonas mangrovi]
MFILSLTYQKPLAEVDQFVDAHRAWLKAGYKRGFVLASGPKKPRDGGVILCRLVDREAVEAFYHNDPFFKEGIAQYEVMEFSANMAGLGLNALLD